MKNRRKKNVRFRGQKTHGWGAKKKHRGAGHRGGRGRSGSGKRADQKKPSYWKTERPGKRGFTSRSRTHSRATTIRYIDEHIETFIAKNLAKKDNAVYIINLQDLGFDKLLATGHANHAFHLKVTTTTPRAMKKIEAAGGRVEKVKEKGSS